MPGPTVPALAYERSLEEKMAIAAVALINSDTTKFATFYGGRCRYIPQLIEDDLIQLPDLMVQNVFERDALNRMLALAASPFIHLRFLMFEPVRVTPYTADEADKIESRIVHLEKLLEYGSEGDDGAGKGWLIDPDSDPGDPPVLRYLNDHSPRFTRFAPVIHDLSKDKEQTSIAMLYTLIASYETSVNRLTRRRQ